MSLRLYEQIVACAMDYIKSDIIHDCAIGSRCLAIETDGGIGMAYLDDEVWQKSSLNPGIRVIEDQLRGSSTSALIKRYLDDDPLYVALGLAAANSCLIHTGRADAEIWYETITAQTRLGMIGYFCPILERLAFTKTKITIFELRPLPGTHRPEEAPQLLPQCDTVLFTGASLSNKTLHTYIPHLSPTAHALIVGHSTPFADCLLDRFQLGSSLVTDKEAVFAGVRQGHGVRQLKPYLSKVMRQAKRSRVQHSDCAPGRITL